MEWGKNGKKIWYKIVPVPNDDSSANVYIADYKADDDFVDWSFHNSASASVDHFYTPIYNGSLDSNTKLRSLSGKNLMASKTATQERTFHCLGTSVELLDECSDVNTVLAQSGTYRGGSGSLSGVDLKLDNTSDFLCHYKHLLNKMW